VELAFVLVTKMPMFVRKTKMGKLGFALFEGTTILLIG